MPDWLPHDAVELSECNAEMVTSWLFFVSERDVECIWDSDSRGRVEVLLPHGPLGEAVFDADICAEAEGELRDSVNCFVLVMVEVGL